MSFQKGEKVVQGGQGLGEVREITSFADQKFLQIAFPGGLKTMVPLERARQMLRRPMARSQAELLLADVKGAAPDPRHWRHRYRYATKVLVEGSVRQRAALLGQFYALRAVKGLSFAERKIHDDAERAILSELAFVLEREQEPLTEELLEHFRKNPPEAREPDEELSAPVDRTVPFPKQGGEKINGWRYLGSFTCGATMNLGERGAVLTSKAKRKRGPHEFLSLEVASGAWNAYQRDVEGAEAVFFVHANHPLEPDVPTEDLGAIAVESDNLAALDADQRELTEVTENLRWEMSPAGRCFPWGVALYVPAGERAYSVHGARNKDKLVAIRLAY